MNTWPVAALIFKVCLVDSCGFLVASNCEEFEPVLVVKFCHVHQIRHFHAGFGELSEECTDKLAQIKFVMLRNVVILPRKMPDALVK